jgi:hypothetical protein
VVSASWWLATGACTGRNFVVVSEVLRGVQFALVPIKDTSCLPSQFGLFCSFFFVARSLGITRYFGELRGIVQNHVYFAPNS